MRTSNGCSCSEGCIAACVGWFLLFLCGFIGEICKINPFGVFLILVILFIVIPICGGNLYYSAQEKNYDKHLNRVQKIQQEYNLAYRKFIDANGIKIVSLEDHPELSELKKISSRKDSVWEEEEKAHREKLEKLEREWKRQCKEWKEKADRIKNDYPEGYKMWEEQKNLNIYINPDRIIAESKEQIVALDKHVKTEKWEKAQSEYASQCCTLSKQFLAEYGRYSYNIPFTKYDVNGNEISGTYKVWQFFCNFMCLEDLDYTYFPGCKERASILLPGLKDKSRYYITDVYTAIAQFIKEVANHYCKDNNNMITVILNYDKDWNKDALNYHYYKLEKILFSEEYEKQIFYIHSDVLLYDEKNIDDRFLISDDHIIIVDIATNNKELKELCKKIITYDRNAHPVISYISLLKEYDKDEMISLINKENQRQAKLKEEREKELIAKNNLVEGASSWDVLVGGLHYSSLFYYYPTTCDFEPTEQEWANRWIVWDFKNTPGKTSESAHKIALDKVIPMLKEKLLTTFEEDSLKYLTLVCIPASSQAKTQARYEEFSNRICRELGITNAYPYITVVSEKEERRSGGTSIDPRKLSFDEDFFKGRYVLLFDDVITRGDSMRTFKHKMESIGAIVVGGLSLGKTKHERPIQGNISQPSVELDDLPI